MAAPVPTQEPTILTAGDSVSWTRSFNDFKASDGWALSYSFLLLGIPQGPVQFSAAASGHDFLVTLTPGDTEVWLSGEYNGQGYVTKGTDRYTVWTGSWTVLPNLANGQQVETRTKNQIALAAVEAALARLADKDVVEATIEGVQMKFRDPKDLIALRDDYLAAVAAEAAIIASKPRRSILARFTLPQ